MGKPGARNVKVESPNEIWVKAASFEERWDTLKGAGEGGQGVGYKVIRKSDQKIAFIKVIQEKSRKNSERRERFYREALAYRSLAGLEVPSLIETNTDRHKDKNITLYIATEFIEGDNMRQWRNRVQKVSLDLAITTTLQLLDTVAQAHAAEILHRDIKPENIIMQDGDVPSPVLVDFGISFDHSRDAQSPLTREGDELGNRFLSLPELNGGSLDKCSPVSDLTLVVGIFFYLFTGRNPTQLKDGQNKLPHQREKSRPFFEGFERSGIRNFFDKAFAYSVSDRYQSPELMRADLLKILSRHLQPAPTDRKERLQRLLENMDFQSNAKRSTRVGQALEWAIRGYGEVRNKSGGSVTAQQVDIKPGAELGYVRIRWDFNGDYQLCTYLWVEASGGELVWYTSSGEVYRIEMDASLEEWSLETFIDEAVEADMLRIFEHKPEDLPAEFAKLHVLRDRLTYSWAAATELSHDLNLPVFVIVHDDTQPMIQREHLLNAVLGERTVQDVILTSFVLLVMKQSVMPRHLQIPEVGDYSAVIHEGRWTRQQRLAANGEAARTRLSELQQAFAVVTPQPL
jgi:serine/threonine-protein kinase